MAAKQKNPEDILQQVVEISDPTEQQAFLAEACEGDEALRAEVESLLAAYTESGSFLDVPALDPEITMAAAPLSEEPGTLIGRYKLLEKIGEGGMATVYMAEQKRPIRRRVALKLIKLGMDSKQVIGRFEAERQALALMDHPNIAKVLDAGTTKNGRPYFVMELVKGLPITEFCDSNHLTTRERLDLFISVCHAVHHAHQKGIIHRDIKPTNIMVTLHDGQPVPKVIDFGIAKAVNQQLTEKTVFTRYAQMIGTPEYMSPEQAEMSGLDVDTRTDVFSLGVLLYELLTGTTPFDSEYLLSKGYNEMQRIIREEEPIRPSTKISTLGEALTDVAKHRRTSPELLCRLIRTDLDWIVMKTLEKDRKRRYESVSEFAADIKRHLNHEPVMAGRPSTAYRLHKFVRRNRILVASFSCVGVILALATAVSLWQTVRANRAAERERAVSTKLSIETERALEAEQAALAAERVSEAARLEEAQQRRQAQAQALAHQQISYSSDMNLAAQALSTNNLGRARRLLNRHRPSSSPLSSSGLADLRGWEWRYLWGQSQSGALHKITRIASCVNSLSISHDGKWLAVGGVASGVAIWNLQTREQLTSLIPDERWVRVAFSPVEALLAFSSVPNLRSEVSSRPNYEESSIRLWDGTTRQIIDELPLEGSCLELNFSADGRFIVSSSKHINALGHTRDALDRITVWDVLKRKELHRYTASQTYAWEGTPLALARDGKFAVHATEDRMVRVINLETGDQIWSAEAADESSMTVALSYDARILASGAGYSESAIRLWDISSGEEIGLLQGHGGWISDLHFWPDGKTLASASSDQTIRIWDVSDPHKGKLINTLTGHTAEVWRIALMPDNKTLVSGAKDGSVLVWDTTRQLRDEAFITLLNIAAWQFVDEGAAIVTLDRMGNVFRHQGSGFCEKQRLFEVGEVHDYALTLFSSEGGLLALGVADGSVQIRDLSGGKMLRHLVTPPSTQPIAFLAKGTKLVTANRSTDLHSVWNLDTGKTEQVWLGAAKLAWGNLPAFTRDETLALTVDHVKGTAVLRNMVSRQESDPPLDIDQASGVVFSPSGNSFAASSSEGFVKLWETKSLREMFTFRGFRQGVHSVGFSPDGKRLVAGGGGLEAVKIWDVESHQELLTLSAPGSIYCRTAFSPDGHSLGSMNDSGVLCLWWAPSWEEIEQAEVASSTSGK